MIKTLGVAAVWVMVWSAGAMGQTTAATTAPASGRAALPKSATVWEKLPTAEYRGKQDDVFFVSADVGFYVNGGGKIYKTVDGGKTFVAKVDKPGTYFRCIAFVDDKVGIAGNVGPGYFPNVTDATPLYRTTDGGETWTAVTQIEGAPVVGLCALEVVRTPFVNAGNLDYRTRVVAVGRVGGPAAYIYSDDLGATWKQHALPAGAAMAFDVHFFDDKRGVLASASDGNVAQASGAIFTTADGGVTWVEAYRSARPFEITWKLSFPTEKVGYATLQSYNPDPAVTQRFVVKTTDGGATWKELPLVEDAKVRCFGVAFVDEKHGFVGAMPGGFETTDGGATWQAASFGNAVNKIRVVADKGETRLYAIGMQLHRLVIGGK